MFYYYTLYTNNNANKNNVETSLYCVILTKIETGLYNNILS